VPCQGRRPFTPRYVGGVPFLRNFSVPYTTRDAGSDRAAPPGRTNRLGDLALDKDILKPKNGFLERFSGFGFLASTGPPSKLIPIHFLRLPWHRMLHLGLLIGNLRNLPSPMQVDSVANPEQRAPSPRAFGFGDHAHDVAIKINSVGAGDQQVA
jgi:hypothetical protein